MRWFMILNWQTETSLFDQIKCSKHAHNSSWQVSFIAIVLVGGEWAQWSQ